MSTTSHPRRGTGFAWAPALVYGALLSCCRPEPQAPSIRHATGAAMGTSYSIKFVTAQPTAAVQARIDDALARFNERFSTYSETSEISRFNRHASTEPFACSAEFTALVGRALRLAERTGGAFDPTIAPVLRLYGFGPGAEEREELPTEAELAAAMQQVGWQKVALGDDGITKSVPDLELDLNAFAKGAGVDVVAGLLDGLGITSYMVEIGGEVRCRGRKPNGKIWRLGVQQPGGDFARFADEVDLLDAAMATSGDYLQFRKIGGQRVHHIIDPRTGRNATSKVVSVTVIASTCELADGLATALMVMGFEGGEALLPKLAAEGVRVLLLSAGKSGLERRTYRWSDGR